MKFNNHIDTLSGMIECKNILCYGFTEKGHKYCKKCERKLLNALMTDTKQFQQLKLDEFR